MPEQRFRPEWVLVGVPVEGGYAVYGSLELDAAVLRAEITRHHDFSLFATVIVPKDRGVTYYLTATLGSFAVSYARTYGEALTQLFQAWDADAQTHPDRAAPPTLGAPQRALPEGAS